VVAGQPSNVSAVLTVGSDSESVIVTAERAHGEAEAINEEKIADNILNVLPSEVITSLPNANIADAVGRLPGVTLERDEGEGKYVQIRGTEPRLANLTIDGVEVPSPEGGVRQVKLDTIPADLIESVQINKTLQANMNGDAIGGSVNLVTKKAGDRPNVTLSGAGGFTPIIDTRKVYEFGVIAGQRFGAQKRLGLMISGSYDFNGRGIDDVEPAPWEALCVGDPASCPPIAPGTKFVPNITSVAIREYLYDRKRFGFGASADYRLSDSTKSLCSWPFLRLQRPRPSFRIYPEYEQRCDFLRGESGRLRPGVHHRDPQPCFSGRKLIGGREPRLWHIVGQLAVRGWTRRHEESHRGRRIAHSIQLLWVLQQLPV
jgi:TonB-dependent receptor